jgi:ribonuclease HII
MQISDFKLEKELSKNSALIIGLDEVGRGPLAGPVVAGASILKILVLPSNNNSLNRMDFLKTLDLEIKNFNLTNQLSKKKKSALSNQPYQQNWNLIRDSKMLSEKQRNQAFDFTQEKFLTGVGICQPKTIDRINILQASFLAMKKALTDLKNKIPNWDDQQVILLIDGNQYIPNLSLKQKCVPQGDKRVKSISAASIVAKVKRDKMMIDWAKKYPVYGFEKHKGYGTKIHMEALKKFGACEIHRRSFAPVKKVLKRGSQMN